MKYSVISCINGNFKIEAECGDNKQLAFTTFHSKCTVYWNATDVITGMVMVIDEKLNLVENKKEFITHSVEPEPTEE